MQKLYFKLKHSDFIRHNSIYFVGSFLVAFLNYLYHPILSRLLDLKDFGEVQAIFSLSVQIGIVLNVIGLVALNIESNKASSPEKEKLLRDMHGVALYTLATISAVLLLFSGMLMRTFQFDSILPFFILAIILLTNLPITFRRAYLQAIYDFTGLSLSNIIMAGTRLVFAVGLVILGYRTTGALGALVIAQLISLWYLYIKTRTEESLRPRYKPALTRALFEEMRYIFLTLVSTGFIAFLTTGDILFAKYYFDPATAGSYSGISTIARSIFFATASISAVLLPSIKLTHTYREHMRIFLRSLFLLMTISIALWLLFFFFPHFFIKILVGSKFLDSAWLLPRLSFVMLLASIINLCVYYGIALRQYRMLWAVLVGLGVSITQVSMLHTTPGDIVNGFLYGALSTLAIFIVLFVSNWYRSYRDP